ncbi:uncharacterized protein LOC124437897 [Xenia sp. Carnegie-2017]|uniref:uncharacterized protein LOC124437897 n=1 Tax=Xenia sp. Carnegie-2017 TaxID=2897299 RepID=UPI001F03615E|nr:uncharacterized protein LOC124437897 [Xenia sp. Carnegie-2017]
MKSYFMDDERYESKGEETEYYPDYENAEDNLDEHIKIFKSKFFEEHSNIKADVCNVLESFTWLHGEYGTAGPNEKMPFLHLYVMVDDSQEKSNEIIKQEIDEKFGWEASKYIDLPRKAPKKANFRLLSDFRAARKDEGGSEEANHDDNFHKLLDKSKNIKADVHKALQSCSWLSGKYMD